MSCKSQRPDVVSNKGEMGQGCLLSQVAASCHQSRDVLTCLAGACLFSALLPRCRGWEAFSPPPPQTAPAAQVVPVLNQPYVILGLVSPEVDIPQDQLEQLP